MTLREWVRTSSFAPIEALMMFETAQIDAAHAAMRVGIAAPFQPLIEADFAPDKWELAYRVWCNLMRALGR